MKRLHQSEIVVVAPRLRPITKTSISEEIAEQVVKLISTGELQPGQRLPSERDLCAQFGVSRTSLREAMRCLSIVGVLSARVGNGTAVATDGEAFLRRIVEWRLVTERHDLENLMDVRIALEGVSAASAAHRARKEDIERFEAILAKMRIKTIDARRFATLDIAFHVAIARASGNSLVFDLVSMIRNHLVRVIPKVLELPNALSLSTKEHTNIVEAIKRHDSEAARAAMHAHLKAHLMRYRFAKKRIGASNGSAGGS